MEGLSIAMFAMFETRSPWNDRGGGWNHEKKRSTGVTRQCLATWAPPKIKFMMKHDETWWNIMKHHETSWNIMTYWWNIDEIFQYWWNMNFGVQLVDPPHPPMCLPRPWHISCPSSGHCWMWWPPLPDRWFLWRSTMIIVGCSTCPDDV